MTPLLASCLVLLAADAPGEVTLRHRFEPGQVIRYAVANSSDITLQQSESTQSMSHSSDSLKRYVVESVNPDGSAVLELSIESVAMRATDSEGTELFYDSRKGEAPPELVQVAATVGPPVAAVTVTPRGEVTAVEDLLGLGTSEQQFTQSNNHTLVVVPESPVRVGSRWKQPFEVAVRPDPKLTATTAVKCLRTYEVSAIDANRVTIAWRSIVLTPVSDPTIESQVAHLRLKGTIVFDHATGRVVSRNGRVEAEVVGFEGPDTLMRKTVQTAETLQGTVR